MGKLSQLNLPKSSQFFCSCKYISSKYAVVSKSIEIQVENRWRAFEDFRPQSCLIHAAMLLNFVGQTGQLCFSGEAWLIFLAKVCEACGWPESHVGNRPHRSEAYTMSSYSQTYDDYCKPPCFFILPSAAHYGLVNKNKKLCIVNMQRSHLPTRVTHGHKTKCYFSACVFGWDSICLALANTVVFACSGFNICHMKFL